jgi:hypothetical protein
VRKFLALILTPLALLAGCGGSGTSHSGPPPPPPPPPTQVITPPGPPNAEKIVVDEGPTALTVPAVNTAFISVKVCMPDGTFSSCQTIDHIEVDTGSIGLRIITGLPQPLNPSAGQLTLALPPVPDPNNVSNMLAECYQFADGFSWGSVNKADIYLPVSGESATNVYIHVIGASSAGNPANPTPTNCVPKPPLVTENTVPSFGANGILGVGPFINDCNSVGDCSGNGSAVYYGCTATATPSCAKTTVHLADQLPNPATLFATDKNGVIVELPAVGDSGKVEPVQGTLVFGIGTRSNNGLGGARKLLMCDGSNTAAICMLNGQLLAGTVSASLNGTTYQVSYLDSGSNANFFPTSITKCLAPNDGFLCPSSTTSENATLTGTDGLMVAADFDVANANSLFSPTPCTPNCLVAFSNLAGPGDSSPDSLDLGLSFFFGRNVFTGIEPGPYFAY